MLPAHSSSTPKTDWRPYLPFLMAILLPMTPALGAGARATPVVQAAPLVRSFNFHDIVLPNGYLTEVIASSLDAPTTDLFDGNDLTVAEPGGGNMAPPRILRIRLAATCTGLVGIYNYPLRWLSMDPGLFETPCQDVKLLGQNCQTPNPLSADQPTALTGAYQSFGTPSTPEQIIAKPPGKPAPGSLWEDRPPPNSPYSQFQPYVGAGGFAFSPGCRFGFQGSAFVAMFGAFPALIREGETSAVGARVVRVDANSKQVSDFATNRTTRPSAVTGSAGLDRPTDLAFALDQSLYIVDWGAVGADEKGDQPAPRTGATRRIYPKGEHAMRPGGPVVIPPTDKTLGSARMSAPAGGGRQLDFIQIISLILGSFVIAIGAMVLARRYWMR